MPWAIILPIILQLVGPYLSEWAKKILDLILRRAAADQPEANSAWFRSDLANLLVVAEGQVWFWQVGRKAVLRAVRRAVMEKAFEIETAARAGGWHAVGGVPSLSDNTRQALESAAPE